MVEAVFLQLAGVHHDAVGFATADPVEFRMAFWYNTPAFQIEETKEKNGADRK